MGGADIGALGQRFGADHRQGDGLIPVVVVDFVTGLHLHTGSKGLVAPVLRLPDSPGGGFPLGLAGVHKGHIAAAVGVHLLPLFRGNTGVAVLGSHQKRLPEFISGHG